MCCTCIYRCVCDTHDTLSNTAWFSCLIYTYIYMYVYMYVCMQPALDFYTENRLPVTGILATSCRDV